MSGDRTAADDWRDDAVTFGDGPAFVTVTGPLDYTDFNLTPAQVRAMFEALARADDATA